MTTRASYRYHLLNVFTRDAAALSGNPLCVFEDGSGLDDATQQSLARQFNLSETTFLLPSRCASARVRIFTPDFELPFAGHPTLGTAHVVRLLAGAAAADSLTLEMLAGVIQVAARGDQLAERHHARHPDRQRGRGRPDRDQAPERRGQGDRAPH